MELGWAVYISVDGIPPEWIREFGETRPADDEYNELSSSLNDSLITSHPVLVALSLQACWAPERPPHPHST